MPLEDIGGHEYTIDELIDLLKMVKLGCDGENCILKIRTPLGSWNHILVAIDKRGRDIPIF